MTVPLTLEEFLAAPIETVQTVAPPTVIYGPAGTRRAAVLAGAEAQSNVYADWGLNRLFHFCDLFFQHGVRHLFVATLLSKSFRETTSQYREHLWQWAQYVASDESLALYRQRGWQVRILYHQHLPELRETVERLQVTHSAQARHTLWYSFTPDHFLPIRWMLDTLGHASPQSLDEAIQLLYGESIPQATLYISYGKPSIDIEIIPPMIYSLLNSYWLQTPYSLDERQLRTIFYDHAYIRQTWKKDKAGRAEQAMKYRKAWETGPTLGLGMRLGSFWYPAPVPAPPLPGDET